MELGYCSEAEAAAIAAGAADEPTNNAALHALGALSLSDAATDTNLKVDEVSATLGYPPDDFQKRCLSVINDASLDLLAMAPTGSGKTAVALMAILQAFRLGKRA
eukprot:3628037-Pleurochrysis_carterae.AAC.1